jgi:hypothetical protein
MKKGLPTKLLIHPAAYKQARQIMGYRSDVAYTIRAVNNDSMKAEQAFFTFLAEAKSKDEYRIALDEVMIDEKKLMIYWMCESIKWYDSFEYVKSHKALYALAEEYGEGDDSALAGKYVEIGEDNNDVVEESFGNYDWDWLYMRREICVDWNEEKT